MNRSPEREGPIWSSPRELAASRRTEAAPVHWAIVGAASAGTVGAVVGLIVGLFVHPPTALFAMFELGLPAGIVGGVVGLLVGSILALSRRISRNRLSAQRPRDSERSGM